MRTSAGYTRYLVALVCALILFQAGVSRLSVLAANPSGSPAPSASPVPSPSAQPSAPPASPGPEQSAAPSPSLPDVSPTPTGSVEPSASPTAPPDPGVELVDHRTAYSQTFAQADGTWRVEEFADPAFYQPEGATDWQPIDLHFGRPSADGATASVANAPARLSLFPADSAAGFLRLDGKGQSISFGLPAGTQPGADHATAQILDSSAYAEYADFLPGGIGLRVFPQADGFTSFLVIPARPASNVFSFSVSADLALLPNDDGSYSFRDEKGTEAGRLPKPYLVNSSDLEGRGGGLYSEAVTMAVSGDRPYYTMTLTVDPAFLDQAVYPLYLDPTTTNFPADCSCTANDTFASSKYPGSNFNTYQRPDSPFYKEMWHGNEPGTSYYNEVYIRFNDLESTLGSTHVDSASLQLYPYHQFNSPRMSWVERIAAGWDAGTLTWNLRPSTDASITSGNTSEGTYSDFDVTSEIQDVVNGAYANNGFMIHANSLGQGGWKRFVSRNDSSSFKPKLVVTVTPFGTPTPASPLNGVGSSSRTLTWTLPTGAVQHSYIVQTATDSGFTQGLVTSAETTSSTPSHTIPSNVALTDGTPYYWHVKVKYGNNSSFTSYSANTSFVYIQDPRRGDESFYTRVPFDLGGGWRMAVGVHNGELTVDRDLFEIPSYGPAQSLSLSYSSQDAGSVGKFGPGWHSNLTQYLTFPSASVIQWHRQDGGLLTFLLVGSTWTPAAGHYETLTLSGSEYTLTQKDQTKLVFESTGAGRLKRITNRFGKSLTLNWAASPVTATDASGRVTQVVISSGLVTSATDSAGRGWSFAYTAGALTSVTDPEGKATTIGYTSGLLTSITRTRSRVVGSPETITWSIAYTSGVVTGVADPINSSVANTFGYNGATTTVGLLKEYAGPVRNTWTYTLDAAGRVTSALDPEGYTTGSTFDANSNLTQLVLPIDHSGTTLTIDYTYDTRGNVLTQTTQLSATQNVVTALSYNATNDLLTRSEADNDASLKLVTRYAYDGSGHLTSINVNCTTTGTTPPSNASTCTGAGTQDSSTNLITTYTYTANHQVDTETDPRGIVTKHVYDSHGNETSTIQNYVAGQGGTSERNVTTTYAFDQQTSAGKAGLVTSMTDPVGNTTTYTWDRLGRQTTENLPGDASIPALTRTTTYDELGNMLTETDTWTGVNRTTTHAYDKANRETILTDPANVERTTNYNAAGNAVSTGAAGVTTTRVFDGMGNATSETVGSSVTSHDFDGQCRESRTIDPEGVATTRSYDRGGRLTEEIVDPQAENLATTHVYDLLGRETSSVTPDGVASSTSYDRMGRVTSSTVAGATTTNSYDRAGNETSTTAPDGTLTTTQYDALDRATVVVANDVANPSLPTEDVTTRTYYDAADQAIASIDAAGTSSRSIYNARGLAKESIANCTDSGTTPTADPPNCTGAGTHNEKANIVTTAEYDGSGATIVSIVAQGTAAAATVEYAYDAAGRQQAVKDPRGTVTRTLYDSYGQVAGTVVNCTEDTSNPAPPSASWWNCDGRSLHDGTWNVTTSRSYDSHGNVASETAPNGRVTTYLYDDADRLVQRIDNDVAGTPAADEDISTYYAYDDAGRQSAVRTPTADRSTLSVTRYLYNDQGQLMTEFRNCTDLGTTPPGDPAWKICTGAGTHDADTNQVTNYGYDDRGNRVSLTAPDPSATSGTSTATVTTRYAFDDQNRLCGVLENATESLASPDPCVAPGNGTDTTNVWNSYGYDSLGNMVSMTDGEGHTTSYAYDEAGRMTGLTDALGNTTSYGYDDLGRRISQSARGSGPQPNLVTWTYDAAGRPASRTTADGTTSYQYDNNGNQTSASATGSTITTTYDRLNRPLTVTVSGDSSATTSYIYSLDSPSWTDPSGAYGASLDAFGRQITLTDPVHGTAWTWTYRADGQPTSVDVPNGNTTTHAYDDAGVPAAKSTTNNSGLNVGDAWTRNRAGNILSETSQVLVNSVPTNDPINAQTSYTYDPLGRLTAFTRSGSTTSYGWQAVPNRERVQVDQQTPVSYDFDAANRETMSSLGDITYDAEGRLIARPGQTLTWNSLGQLITVADSATRAPIGAYTYDAIDRLLTVTHASDVKRFRYVGLTTNVAQVVDDADDSVIYRVANDWQGERLFQWDGGSQAFYGTNGHHDVIWTADESGDVSETLLYDPWGNLAATSGTNLPDLRFQGSWFDSQVELSWLITRWYAPGLARFISEDSVAGSMSDPSGRNLYAYVAGNPLRAADPYGYGPDGGGGQHSSGPFWHRVKPGEYLGVLANRYFGTSHKWPIIFNQNRHFYRNIGEIPVGSCIYVDSYAANSDCTGYKPWITGNLLSSSRTKAAKALGVDWWMLTTSDLQYLTEAETGFKVNGRSSVYLGNLAVATMVGASLAILDGASFFYKNDRWAVFIGSSSRLPPIYVPYFNYTTPEMKLPLKGAAATTFGSVMFYDSRADYTHPYSPDVSGDIAAMALHNHEYIHIMQYAGNPNQFSDYLSQCAHLPDGACGDPANKYEAIAYLWSAWITNYYIYGGPNELPEDHWKTPKLADQKAMIKAWFPWPF